MDNFYDQLENATDEDLWEILPKVEGEQKGDVLCQLALSYAPERDGNPAIAIAELAMETYLAAGCPEDSSDFAFLWAVVAENKAMIEDYEGAALAGAKALPLIEMHEIDTSANLKWDMVKWLGLAGREMEAHLLLTENLKKQEGN